MHGRIKVRTSAEEAARKKKEQDQKVKAYRQGIDLIFNKKKRNEFDDEMMQATAAVLSKNPDIQTLWNIRRECLLLLKSEHNDKQLADPSIDDETLVKIFLKDLSFTENCLLVNPKSYCAWHHRCWILENIPHPNWQREIDLCDKYLKMDERNFHCWSYRRYIVAKAEVPPIKELDFCTKKIEKNFSNYSSWHYRSQLLPILHPHPTDPSRPINEEILKNELEMVLTAAFTDPNDSSAWFYQRWLLGYSAPALDLAAFKLKRTYALVSFTKPVNLRHPNCSLILGKTSTFQTINWHPIRPNATYDTIWILHDTFELNTNSDLQFDLDFIDETNETHSLIVRKCDNDLFGLKRPQFGYEFEQTIVDELKVQLDSCSQLLDIEPDSKWTLLTAALLMRAIDRQNYHSKAIEYLNKLKACDSLRSGYYADLSDKWNIEQKLDKWIGMEFNFTPIKLNDLNLVSLHYEQYLCVADVIYVYESFPDRGHKIDILRRCGVEVL